MTAEQWDKTILDQLRDSQAIRELVSRHLAETDAACQILKDKGYGVAGTPLLEMVKQVPLSIG